VTFVTTSSVAPASDKVIHLVEKHQPAECAGYLEETKSGFETTSSFRVFVNFP